MYKLANQEKKDGGVPPSGGSGGSNAFTRNARDAVAPPTCANDGNAHDSPAHLTVPPFTNENADTQLMTPDLDKKAGILRPGQRIAQDDIGADAPPIRMRKPHARYPEDGHGLASSLKPPGREVKKSSRFAEEVPWKLPNEAVEKSEQELQDEEAKQRARADRLHGAVASLQDVDAANEQKEGGSPSEVPWKLSTENKDAGLSKQEQEDAAAKQKARAERSAATRLQEMNGDSKKPATLPPTPTTQEEKYQATLKYEKERAWNAPTTYQAKNKTTGENKEEEEHCEEMAAPVSSDFVTASEPPLAPDFYQPPGAVAVPGSRGNDLHEHPTEDWSSFDKSDSFVEENRSPTKDQSSREVLLNAVLVEETQENTRVPDIPYAEATAVKDENPGRKRLFIFGILALVVVGIVVGVTVPLTARGSPSQAVIEAIPTASPVPSSSPTEFPTMAPTSSATVTVVIQLDDKPEETGWRLTCGSQTIADVPPSTYEDTNRLITVQTTVGLNADCEFTLRDSGGDGVTNGYFEVYFGEEIADESALLLRGSGDFTNTQVVPFQVIMPPTRSPTVSPAPSLSQEGTAPITVILQLDQYPAETGWGLQCDGIVLASVTSGTYAVQFELISETFLVEEGAECVFDITDSAGDGLCCLFGAGAYSIFLGEDATGILLDEGGEFGSQDRVPFIATPPVPTMSPAPTTTMSPTDSPACVSICPDGGSIDPAFSEAIVEGFNSTCAIVQLTASLGLFSTDEECGLLFYLGVKYCGCDPTFDFCDLCEDGSVLPDALFAPTPDFSCAGLGGLSFAESITSSDRECTTTQATYGEYCGCSNPTASEGACYICGDDPVPDPGRTVFVPEFGNVFCAQLEYEANLPGADAQCASFQTMGSSCCGIANLTVAPNPSVIPSPSPSVVSTVPPAAQECTSSLDSIFFAEEAVVNDSVLRIYNLCPNTTYEVDTEFDDNDVPVNGKQRPLIFGRSNMIVLCGTNGRSENGCILTGGVYQAAFEPSIFGTTAPLRNVLVEGLTFSQRDNSTQIPNVFALITGEITLRDCIFSVRRGRKPTRILFMEEDLLTRHYSCALCISLQENSVDWSMIVQEPGFGARRRSGGAGNINGVAHTLLDHSLRFNLGTRRLQFNQNVSSLVVTVEDCRFHVSQFDVSLWPLSSLRYVSSLLLFSSRALSFLDFRIMLRVLWMIVHLG